MVRPSARAKAAALRNGFYFGKAKGSLAEGGIAYLRLRASPSQMTGTGSGGRYRGNKIASPRGVSVRGWLMIRKALIGIMKGVFGRCRGRAENGKRSAKPG